MLEEGVWRWVYRKSGENREMIGWKAVEEKAGASEQSDEVMTRSRMWFLLWVGKFRPTC